MRIFRGIARRHRACTLRQLLGRRLSSHRVKSRCRRAHLREDIAATAIVHYLASKRVIVACVIGRVLVVEVVRRLWQRLPLIGAKRRQKLAPVVRERVRFEVGVAAHSLDMARAEASREDAVVSMAHNVL